MKKITFTKMHGLGNDFVILNAIDLPMAPKDLPIEQLANRNLGIGFDQLLVVTAKQKNNEFFCQIFNADGSEAEQCGNGLRCVARYVQETGLTDTNDLNISTIAGSYQVNIRDYDNIHVKMGVPAIEEKIIEVNGDNISYHELDLGNPHAIFNLDSVKEASLHALANKLTTTDYFAKGMNVGFIHILSPNEISLRTYERGAGETLACGSNACAAAVTGITNGWVKSPVQIDFQLGSLNVNWDGEGKEVELAGPATTVFHGEFEI